MKAILVAALLALAAACSPGASTTAPAPSASAVTSGVSPGAQAYVDAVNNGDLDALVRSFAPTGEVVDVSRTISGPDAIRRWADAEVIGGTLQVLDIVERRQDGQKLLVRWVPKGSPGGFNAHYDFTIADGRITKAALQYAD